MKVLKFIFEKFKKLKLFLTNYSYYKWVKDSGDEKLLLDYELDKNSIFFELGGYNGTYSQEIFDKFNPQMYIFEPSKEYYKVLLEKFDYPNVNIYNFGLSNENKTAYLNYDNDATHISQTPSSNYEKVELKKLSDFISSKNINFINLININIEGSEYEVLEDLINSGFVNIIDNIQIQYHKNIDSYKKKRTFLNHELSKSHNRLWNYDYVWERWTKF